MRDQSSAVLCECRNYQLVSCANLLGVNSVNTRGSGMLNVLNDDVAVFEGRPRLLHFVQPMELSTYYPDYPHFFSAKIAPSETLHQLPSL